MSFALPQRSSEVRSIDERPYQATTRAAPRAPRLTTPAADGPGIDAPRLAALDGIRGIAILLVIVMHCAQSVAIDTSLVVSGTDRAILALARYGWVGVDLFCVAIAALALRCVLAWQGMGMATLYVLTPTRRIRSCWGAPWRSPSGSRTLCNGCAAGVGSRWWRVQRAGVAFLAGVFQRGRLADRL